MGDQFRNDMAQLMQFALSHDVRCDPARILNILVTVKDFPDCFRFRPFRMPHVAEIASSTNATESPAARVGPVTANAALPPPRMTTSKLSVRMVCSRLSHFRGPVRICAKEWPAPGAGGQKFSEPAGNARLISRSRSIESIQRRYWPCRTAPFDP